LLLPENIMAGLNLSVSRHKHPEALDWQNIAGKWIAKTEGGRGFVILHDTQFGFVIAQTKIITYGLGGEAK
jgi:hypothetical protein